MDTKGWIAEDVPQRIAVPLTWQAAGISAGTTRVSPFAAAVLATQTKRDEVPAPRLSLKEET